MLTLAIEATNPNIPTPGVLLARGSGVLARRELRQEGRHDDMLLPAIAELFEEATLRPADLGEVLVSLGPGGFTATRLACAAAAVLAEVAGARVLAVPTVRVAVETALQERNITRGIVVAMASKHDTAYVARYQPMDRKFSEPGAALGPDAFDALVLPGDILIHEGHLPDRMLENVAKRRIECILMRLTADGLLACRSAAEPVRNELLRPIYPREPDAVTQWRRRHGSAPGDA